MTKKLHATGPGSRPLCGRQLSIARQGEGRYDIGQATMGLAAAGQAVTCRHCLRVMGILPALTRSRDAEGLPEEPANDLNETLESFADEAEMESEQ